MNASPASFLVLAIWESLLFIGVLFAYVFTINSYDEACSYSLKPLIIVQFCVVAINSKQVDVIINKKIIFMILRI